MYIVGKVEGSVWFELLCLVGLRVISLLRRWRRLSGANLVNSFRTIGCLDLAQMLLVERAGFFRYFVVDRLR